MKLVSPYRNIKQYTRISVEPYNMNSDIKNYMKIILKKKVEKKCNKNGFVDEVYRIIEYSDGIMPVENLNANAIYNIRYLLLSYLFQRKAYYRSTQPISEQH